MTQMLRLVIAGICLAGLLVGCSEESAQKSATAPVAAAKPPQKNVPAPTPAAAEEKVEKPKFTYQVEGRRDPFVPLTAARRPVGAPEEPTTPLQQYDLIQYRLIGVILGLGEPRAMVVAPDKKSYVIKKGVKIGKNEGVVLEINNEVILVEEKFYDFSGNVRTNIQEIVVPKREGV